MGCTPSDRCIEVIDVTETTVVVKTYDVGTGSYPTSVYLYASDGTTLIAEGSTDLPDCEYTFSGLTPDTPYVVSLANPVSAEDVRTLPLAKLYGSVNGTTKLITKLYGSVDKVFYTYIIQQFLGNTGVDYSKFMTKYLCTIGAINTAPSRLMVYNISGSTQVTLRFANNSEVALFSFSGEYFDQGIDWGFYHRPMEGGVLYTDSMRGYTVKVSKNITKLYGSVNGQTKLIYSS